MFLVATCAHNKIKKEEKATNFSGKPDSNLKNTKEKKRDIFYLKTH